ncbi:hypothetical protein LG3211_1364 [Lysobacter gummosus]|nr:hypothetical protein LG3211_1364 [Lysobacter gummosus]
MPAQRAQQRPCHGHGSGQHRVSHQNVLGPREVESSPLKSVNAMAEARAGRIGMGVTGGVLVCAQFLWGWGGLKLKFR